jgi:predicted permease
MTQTRWIDKLQLRLRSLFHRTEVDADLDDELRDHIEQKAHLYVAQGVARDEARRRALLEFGGVAKRAEECRDARNVTWLEHFIADARFGLRTLRRSPGFSLVAILTLALGIGANTAIFSVIDAAVLRPLPYPEPNRVVEINFYTAGNGGSMNDGDSQQYVFWRDHATTLESVSALFGSLGGFNLSGYSGAVHVSGMKVSHELFFAAGMQPILGRGFSREEDLPNGPNVAVLSYGLWQSAFGADPNIVNRSILINGVPHQVIGVLPAQFRLESLMRAGENPEVYLPLQIAGAGSSDGSNYTILGRLKPGVTIASANADMDRVAVEYENEHPETVHPGFPLRSMVRTLHEAMVSDSQIAPILYVLMGAVGFVLLIACVNVANLFLSRAATRRREIAVRSALGASASRIFSQLIAESLVFAVLAAAVGLAIAYAGTRVLVALTPESVPRVESVSFDWRVLSFTLALSVIVALATGAAAAVYALRTDVNESIKGGGEQPMGASGRKLPRVLIAAEVALSLVLLAGATLLGSTVVHLYRVPLGFDADHLTSASVSLTAKKFDRSEAVADFQARAIERLEAIPGVESAAAASSTPLERGLNTVAFPNGSFSRDHANMMQIEFRAISPQYFRTVGISVLGGREFAPSDSGSSARVTIVNEKLAHMLWPGEESTAVGKPLLVGEGPPTTPARTIVGVVADIREMGVDQDVRPTVYVPQAQVLDEFTAMTNYWFASSLLVRTAGALDVTNDIRRAVAEVDAEQPVARVESMHAVLNKSIGLSRFLMFLMAGFAALALVLACVGIYAVLSYQISRRTREIGIRMALGAEPRTVLRLVLGEGARPIIAGIVVGVCAALALSHLLESMLFGVTAHDPVTYFAVALALGFVAAAACWLPARRATRVDPIVALRHE